MGSRHTQVGTFLSKMCQLCQQYLLTVSAYESDERKVWNYRFYMQSILWEIYLTSVSDV
jgi:hypothetical protein